MRKLLWVVLLASGLAIGCMRRATVPGVPATPVTAMEQFASTNAVLATLNHDVAQGAIRLNATGALGDAATQALLTWNFKVADADRQIVVIVSSTDAAIKKGEKVRTIVATLKTEAAALFGIDGTNPEANRALDADVRLILTIVDTIVRNLEMEGIIQ